MVQALDTVMKFHTRTKKGMCKVKFPHFPKKDWSVLHPTLRLDSESEYSQGVLHMSCGLRYLKGGV